MQGPTTIFSMHLAGMVDTVAADASVGDEVGVSGLSSAVPMDTIANRRMVAAWFMIFFNA